MLSSSSTVIPGRIALAAAAGIDAGPGADDGTVRAHPATTSGTAAQRLAKRRTGKCIGLLS
jgi:hypothetical protein